jgi:hypothetical protein
MLLESLGGDGGAFPGGGSCLAPSGVAAWLRSCSFAPPSSPAAVLSSPRTLSHEGQKYGRVVRAGLAEASNVDESLRTCSLRTMLIGSPRSL